MRRPSIIVSAKMVWRWRTIRKQSAQLAQWPLTLTALASPNPPWANGSDAVTCDPPASTGTFKIWRKHSHTGASCASAYDSDNSGWTPLNQKFALVDAHISRISHADCKSGTTGMRSNNNFGSSDFFSQNRCTNPGCPTGMPKIFTSKMTRALQVLAMSQHTIFWRFGKRGGGEGEGWHRELMVDIFVEFMIHPQTRRCRLRVEFCHFIEPSVVSPSRF